MLENEICRVCKEMRNTFWMGYLKQTKHPLQDKIILNASQRKDVTIHTEFMWLEIGPSDGLLYTRQTKS